MADTKQGFIPEFSGDPADLDDFVGMIVTDMTLDQLAYYAYTLEAKQPIVTPSGYLLPPSAEFGTDNIAGVDTDFPMPIHMGETWDTTLAKQVGEVMGNEKRGRIPSSNPNTVMYAALGDLRSNPLCGRLFEGYAEDPHLVSEMMDSTGRGIIGDDPFYTKAQISTKHYQTYHSEWNRTTHTNFLNDRPFREYQIKAYLKAIRNASLVGVMTSFACNNGIPNVAGPYVDVLKDEAKYNLRNIADYDGDYNLLTGLGNGYDETYAKEPVQVAAMLIKWNVLTLNRTGPTIVAEHYAQAVRDRVLGVTRQDLETFVRAQIELWVRGGYFNREAYPYKQLALDYNPATAQDEASQKLALQAAEDGIVLLKNEGNILPLKKGSKLLTTGMFADYRFQTWYSTPTPAGLPHTGLTFLGALEDYLGGDYAGTVTYAPEITGSRYKLQSYRSRQFLGSRDNHTLEASHSAEESADLFQLYDWGSRAFSIKHMPSGNYIWGSREDNTVRLAKVEDSFTRPPVLTFESISPGYAIRANVFQIDLVDKVMSANNNINFFRQYITYGRYINVANDSGTVVELGNTVLEGSQSSNTFLPSLPVYEAGEGAEVYVADNDYAVVFVGYDTYINASEFDDRPDLNLGADQLLLVKNVAKQFPGKTVVVLRADFPMAVEEIKNNPDVAALLYSSYAGQYDSYAMIRTLFGDSVPSGKLTHTWLKDTSTLPRLLEQERVGIDPYFDVDMKNADPLECKLTYLYNNSADVTYEFGYGLSYTTFHYDDALYRPGNDGVTVNVTVRNTGGIAGREVVQVYASMKNSAYGRYAPKTQLVGFAKTGTIQPGASEQVTILVPYENLEKWDVMGQEYFVEQGVYTFALGTSANQILALDITIPGRAFGPMTFREPTNLWKSIVGSGSYSGIAPGTKGIEVSKYRTAFLPSDFEAVQSRAYGDYVVLPKVDLQGLEWIKLEAAATTPYSNIIIRADSVIGPVIATGEVPVTQPTTYTLGPIVNITGQELSYTTVYPQMGTNRFDGPRDVYIFFGQEDIRIDSIQFGYNNPKEN